MKYKLTITALLAFATLFLNAQNTIDVKIINLENSNGKVMLELVNERQEVVGQEIIVIKDNVATVKFNDIKNGKYAIRFFHDENSNGKMDTGTFGIPTEGYGFSNNARGFMGPPDFEDMIFTVNENVSMTLKTKN